MSDEQSPAEKEHEASQQKLDDARKKGEVPRSPDLSTAAGYGGLLLAAMAFGQPALLQTGEAAAVLLGQVDRLAPLLLGGGTAPVAGLMMAFALAVAPFFVLPAVSVLVSVMMQRALIFTPSKLMPKLNRISPLNGLKTKLGRKGLFEFAKSFAKLIVISVLLGVFLMRRSEGILMTLYLSPGLSTAVLMQQITAFLVLILLISAVLGGSDYMWQRAEHLRAHRMSRKEMLDEHKNAEGDPHTKAKRRQRGYDIATNRMLADVAGADVIVVNPRHYAVALKWTRADGRAPVCVAKGVDEIAARIRERAAEAGVPLHRDPPTARALFATMEIGQEVHPDHYRAVAAAIRFAESMRKKARKLRK